MNFENYPVFDKKYKYLVWVSAKTFTESLYFLVDFDKIFDFSFSFGKNRKSTGWFPLHYTNTLNECLYLFHYIITSTKKVFWTLI